MNKWAFFNDQFIEEEKALLHFRDLSIMRGYGIFDFFKVVNNIPVFIDDHLDRFYTSAAEMRMDVEYSKEELKSIINELLKKNEIADTGVRITLTGGYSPDSYQLAKPNLIISIQSYPLPTQQPFENGIKLITHSHQRQLPQVKTIDYLMAIWLQPLIRQKKADDVLYYSNGLISECPRANIFIVTMKNKIITPAKNVLKGIVRMKTIQLAQGLFECEERDISIDELKAAKEVFITSTTKSILPVAQIDDFILPKLKTVSPRLSFLLQQLENASGGTNYAVV